MTGPKFNPAPKEAFGWALERVNIPNRAKLTGLALAQYMNGTTGQTWVGQRKLKSRWGISSARFRADVAILVAAGVLRVEVKRGPRGVHIHASAARFVGNDRAVRLDDGRILRSDERGEPSSAHPIGGDADESSAHPLSGNADDSASAPIFDSSVTDFDASVTDSRRRNTRTPERSEGGGGGADGPSAGAPVPRPRPEAIEEVLVLIEAALVASKNRTKLPRHDQSVLDAIETKLIAGWETQTIVERVTDESWPTKVERPSSFLVARLKAMPEMPDASALAAAAVDAAERFAAAELEAIRESWIDAIELWTFSPEVTNWVGRLDGVSSRAKACRNSKYTNRADDVAAEMSHDVCVSDIERITRAFRNGLLAPVEHFATVVAITEAEAVLLVDELDLAEMFDVAEAYITDHREHRLSAVLVETRAAHDQQQQGSSP